MILTTVSLGALIDQAVLELRAPDEIGKSVVLNGAIDASTTQIVLQGAANVYDRIEFGSELVQVIAKSEDANPLYTVTRGYYGTTPQEHSSGAVGYVNQTYTRGKIATAILQSFPRLEAFGVFPLKTVVLQPQPDPSPESKGRYVLEVPAEARRVWHVRVGMEEVPNWELVENLPTAVYPTGKVVRLPAFGIQPDEFYVTYQTPYRWDSHPAAPTEDSLVEMPEGTQDLPSSYAVAWMASSREVSRHDLDKVAEWTQGEPTRGGVSGALVRARWQEFYRKLDEARRLDPPLPRRPLVIRRARRGGFF